MKFISDNFQKIAENLLTLSTIEKLKIFIGIRVDYLNEKREII